MHPYRDPVSRDERQNHDCDPMQVPQLRTVPLCDYAGRTVLFYDPYHDVVIENRRWHGRRVTSFLKLPAFEEPPPDQWVPIYSYHIGPFLMEYHPLRRRIRYVEHRRHGRQEHTLVLPARRSSPLPNPALPDDGPPKPPEMTDRSPNP